MQIEFDITDLLEFLEVKYGDDDVVLKVESHEFFFDSECGVSMKAKEQFYQGWREPPEWYHCEHRIEHWDVMHQGDEGVWAHGLHNIPVYGTYEDDTDEITHGVERKLSNEQVEKLLAIWEERTGRSATSPAYEEWKSTWK